MLRLCLFFISSVLLTGSCLFVPVPVFSADNSLASKQQQTRYYETGNTYAVLQAASAVLQDMGFHTEEISPKLGILTASRTSKLPGAGPEPDILVWETDSKGNMISYRNADRDDPARKRVTLSMHAQSSVQKGTASATSLPAGQITKIQQQIHTVLKSELPADSSTAAQQVAQTTAENAAKILTEDMHSFLSASAVPGKTTVRITLQEATLTWSDKIDSQKQLTDEKLYQTFFESLSQSLFLETQGI